MKFYRVTKILEKYVNRESIPNWRWDHAAERGSKFHDCTAKYFKRIWLPPVDPELQGYLTSLMNWADAMILKTILVEKELTCSVYGIVGHIDWAGILKPWPEVIAVLDWKTPVAESRLWRAQLATYHYLADKYAHLPLPIGKCGVVQADPDGGTARFLDYTDHKDEYFNAFLHALHAHRWLADERR